MRDWAWKHSLAIIRVPKGEQMVAGRKENRNCFTKDINVHAWTQRTHAEIAPNVKNIVSNNNIEIIQKCGCVRDTYPLWIYVVLNVLRHAGHYRTTLKGIMWDGII